MTKTGSKILKAAREAVVYARCRHKWVRLTMRVKNSVIVAETFYCDKCRIRKTVFTPDAMMDGNNAG